VSQQLDVYQNSITEATSLERKDMVLHLCNENKAYKILILVNKHIKKLATLAVPRTAL
jgi:hypothetical protein